MAEVAMLPNSLKEESVYARYPEMFAGRGQPNILLQLPSSATFPGRDWAKNELETTAPQNTKGGEVGGPAFRGQ